MVGVAVYVPAQIITYSHRFFYERRKRRKDEKLIKINRAEEEQMRKRKILKYI